jgi:hypothetical protein
LLFIASHLDLDLSSTGLAPDPVNIASD